MKILEISPFSAGICGVSARVLAEAQLLAKRGHEVHVFSSNIFRGEGGKKTACEEEIINKVKIKRFPARFSFGDNTFFWDCEKEALKLHPDVIITHAYRQYYSTKAVKIAKKLNIPCFLVTHAPFLEKKLRSLRLNLAVLLYDSLVGKRILNKYTKVIAITHWEMPILEKLGVKKENIEYLPNGIPDEFFKTKPKKGKNILFLGRISPIKNLESLVFAMSLVKNKKIKLDIIGPAESDYKEKLVSMIKEMNLEKKIRFYPPVFNLKEKIKLIDEHEIFVLPSKREAMPQALIEVKARGKIVISSKSEGGKEMINNNEDGFLFEIDDHHQLAEIINNITKMDQSEKARIEKNASKSVEKFRWSILIDQLEKLLQNSYKA
jgi:glycosyltransferase involved in cell wall biosynthesis